jgi:hypothetical protein
VRKGSEGDLRLEGEAMSLRVVVRTGQAPRRPYSWLIIDDVTEKEFEQSDHEFRTSRLAWEAGMAALDQFRERHQAQTRQKARDRSSAFPGMNTPASD